jgi:hypothetical protein
LAVVPVGIGFVRAWRFRSWDRFALPLPGSTIVGLVGEPIEVPRDLDRRGLQTWVEIVEGEMGRLMELAEVWAARCRRDRHAAPPEVSQTSNLRISA